MRYINPRFTYLLTYLLYTTGTYNNQYMIVDMKKVTLGRELADGTLWVVEQIPGMVVGEDQTAILRFGLFVLTCKPALESWRPPRVSPSRLGPLPGKFLNFLHKNDVFWCTLEHGFKLNHVPARSCADN